MAKSIDERLNELDALGEKVSQKTAEGTYANPQDDPLVQHGLINTPVQQMAYDATQTAMENVRRQEAQARIADQPAKEKVDPTFVGPEAPVADPNMVGPQLPEPQPMGDVGPPDPNANQGFTEQQKADFERTRRSEERQGEREAFNAMMTERARMRRGLDPSNVEARKAVEGGPEGMKKFRQAGIQSRRDAHQQAAQTGPSPFGRLERQPLTSRGAPQPPAPGSQAQQKGQQAPGTPSVAAPGMQTGSTFTFSSPLASGATSTKVYALPGGINMPDTTGMTGEDMKQAFEQMNPGKSYADAVVGMSREGGVAGARARKILRDMNISAGEPLTPAQQAQIEEHLSGEMQSFLSDHVRGQATGIEQGSRKIAADEADRIEKEEAFWEEERERFEERRGKIFDEFQKDKDKDTYKGMSDQAILATIEQKWQQRDDYLAGKSEPSRPASEYYTRTVSPDEGFSRAVYDNPNIEFKDGRPTYFRQGMQNPLQVAVMVDAKGNQEALPVITAERPEDVGQLPPATRYIDEDGNVGTTPGTPEDAPDSSFRLETEEFTAQDAYDEFRRKQEDEVKSLTEAATFELTRARNEQGMQQVRYDEHMAIQPLNRTSEGWQDWADKKNDIEVDLQAATKALEEKKAIHQVSIDEASREPTQQELQDIMDMREGRDELVQRTQMRRAAEGGDAEAGRELVSRLSSGKMDDVRMSPDGNKFIDSNGMQIPVSTVNGVDFPNPQTVEEIFALEINEAGPNQRPHWDTSIPVGSNFEGVEDFSILIDRQDAGAMAKDAIQSALKAGVVVNPDGTESPDPNTFSALDPAVRSNIVETTKTYLEKKYGNTKISDADMALLTKQILLSQGLSF